MYGACAFVFFLIGGCEALLIRLQLATPNGKVLSASAYNQMFTTMIALEATRKELLVASTGE